MLTLIWKNALGWWFCQGRNVQSIRVLMEKNSDIKQVFVIEGEFSDLTRMYWQIRGGCEVDFYTALQHSRITI